MIEIYLRCISEQMHTYTPTFKYILEYCATDLQLQPKKKINK